MTVARWHGRALESEPPASRYLVQASQASDDNVAWSVASVAPLRQLLWRRPGPEPGGQCRGWFGQGRPSGQRDPAGQPINASTGKTVLRFFVVGATAGTVWHGMPRQRVLNFHLVKGRKPQR